MINYAILTTMAGAEGSKGENNEVRRAVDMLREAANLIDCSLQSGRNQGTTRVENSPTLSASTSVLNESCVETMAPTMTTTSTTRGEAVLRNFRNLFAGYGPRESSSTCSRNQRPIQPPTKRAKRQSFFIPKETWTHEFFCLAETNQCRIPSRQDKFVLQSAGLGRKKLVFGSKDTAKSVQEKLEKAYPKLSQGGGFEILRSGASVKELVVIRPPSLTGYAVPFLRNESGLGQALAYIRPVQENLDISNLDLESQVFTVLPVNLIIKIYKKQFGTFSETII